jgi:adenosylhomocysteine nucleosidase
MSEDTTHADIGIVYATPMELAPFIERCERVREYQGGDFVFRGAKYGKIRIALAQAGMGAAKAKKATHALLDGHTPKWVISAGFSGALRPELRIGDIVVGNAVVDARKEPLSFDLRMPADPEKGLHVGQLYQAEGFVRTVAEKKALSESTSALAVDMESLAVAEVCHERKLRYLAVRVISDDLTADLPPEILTVVGSTGALRWGATVAALLKRPGCVPDLWELRGKAHKAAERLATFLEGVVAQLYTADH